MNAPRRGRPSEADLSQRVRLALATLDDPIALEGLPLASRPAVRLLARTKYKASVCAAGRATREVLRTSLADIARDMADFPVGVLARTLLEGRPQHEAAAELRISEEHCSRRWKRPLLALVVERLVALDALALDEPAMPDNNGGVGSLVGAARQS